MSSRLFIFSFSLLSLFLGGCSTVSSAGGDSEEIRVLRLSREQVRGAGVEVGVLGLGEVYRARRLWGKTVVLSHSQASLHAPLEGKVEAILIREGQRVQAGQLCFWLYSAGAIDLQRRYAETYQQLRLAEVRLSQVESLYTQGAATQFDLEQARRSWSQLNVQLRVISDQLRYLSLGPDTSGRLGLVPIRAPLSGSITSVGVVIGQHVRPETELARIVNLSDLHADFYLTERDLAWIRPGMVVEVSLPALVQATPVETRIEYVAPVQDSGGTHLIAHVPLRVPGYAIPAGVPVEGSVRVFEGQAFLLPKAALAQHEGQYYIFRAEADTLFYPEPVEVEFLDTLVAIRSSKLGSGISVVRRGASFLAAELWQVDS